MNKKMNLKPVVLVAQRLILTGFSVAGMTVVFEIRMTASEFTDTGLSQNTTFNRMAGKKSKNALLPSTSQITRI
jgi:hypothetical protein